MARSGQYGVHAEIRAYKGRKRTSYQAWWIDQGGRRRTKESKGWRKADAERYAQEMAALVHGGAYVADPNKATMQDAISVWLADLEERNLKPRELKCCGAYLKSQRRLAKLHLEPHFGALRPCEVTAALVKKWGQRMVATGTMSPNHVRYAAKRLRLVLDFAKEKNWIAVHPLRGVKVELPESESEPVPVPEDADVVAMLDALRECPSGWREPLFNSMRMLLFLVAYAGLRPNEASALDWSNVDLDQWEIRVRRGLTVEEGLKDSVKTRSGRREITIMPILYAELVEYRERTRVLLPRPGRYYSRDKLAALAANPSGLVIRNDEVERLMPQDAGIHWRKIRKHFGLRLSSEPDKSFSLYSLRHYAGSVWLRGGISLANVSKMMGHSSIEVTERHYIRILRELDELRLREMQRVDASLVERYGYLGLELPSAPMPQLEASQPALPFPVESDQPSAEVVERVPDAIEIAAGPAAQARTMAELKEQQMAEAFRLFDDGMGLPRIARRIDVSEATLRNWIDDRHTNVVLGNSRHRQSMSKAELAELMDRARQLAEQEGLSYREIAVKLGVRVGALRAWAYRHGWRAPRKAPVSYNRDFKTDPETRARNREAMRRHRAKLRSSRVAAQIEHKSP
jgi:integrase/transposase